MLRHKSTEDDIRKIIKEKDRLDSFDSFGMKYVTLIEETKFGETVLISFPDNYNESLVIIRLISVLEKRIHPSPINLTFNGSNMHIGDLQILHEGTFSRGYGTKLMEHALSIARKRSVKIITGTMAGEGPGQRERQVGLYKKFDFSIEGNEIKLKL